MFKRSILISIFIILAGIVYSQQKHRVELGKHARIEKNSEEVRKISNGIVIKETINSLELVEKETKQGAYQQIFSEGMSKTFDPGKPDLPVINRLIEIPNNYRAEVKLISYDEEIVKLSDLGLTKKIHPAQPSVEKSRDPKDVPFIKDEQVYNKNEFYKKETIKFEDLGFLRDKHLGYLEISPFAYNPVTNTLKVLKNIEIRVDFIPQTQKTSKRPAQLSSPYFNSINYQTLNTETEPKALINGPVKYVIVSDRMFEETLQEFVDWKTQKGFIVVEAYTDEIGSTTSDIKAYLQDLYDNPSDGISPTFGLLVGDVNQVPTFDGTAGGHKTDLYYFEYTNDKLPEVFYGRFSAETIDELQAQIDKTLEVEKYEMPDPSYLDNVVLVAGVDGSYAPTYGNGAINYANDYYTKTENGITSYFYLYGDDSGVMASNNSGASASIRSYISSGVSFSNYTAHCGSSGWSDPSFSISHIDGLTNEHMYPLIIGNCCQSNTFYNDDCFGEELLMAANKGAVGYIGGSNYTYWDEDYYWGVGLSSSIIANPTYEETDLGAYDRFFHLNGETKEDWYITQGQINVAGNLAVQASTSSRKTYYWEIYHLMGDPSLTPFVTVPEVLSSSYNSEIIVGSSSFDVDAEENAYVALSQNGILLDAKLVDATGTVQLSFDPLSEVGTANVVITKQNRQPVIDEINVVPATTPYVVLDYFTLIDSTENNDSTADFGETVQLDIQLKNLSDSYDALNVSAKLISLDTNVNVVDSIQVVGDIAKSDSSFIASSFTVEIKNDVYDQQKVSFNLEITGEDLGSIYYTWESKIDIIIDAPKLEINEVFVNDTSTNDNGILDPGETTDISLIVKNIGHSKIQNLVGLTSILGSGGSHITINTAESDSFDLEANQTDTVSFNVTANSETLEGTLVYLNFQVNDNMNGFYAVNEDKEISIGQIPEILITGEDTTIVSKGYFYDSGGSENNYTHDERDTLTIRPFEAGKYINVEFLEFNIESDGSGCYDYLEIYDGENTDADLIGSYCNSNIPENITASNPSGALTFRFYSDYSVAYQGWKAELTSIAATNFNVSLSIVGPDGPIEDAVVELHNTNDTTNSEGIVLFENIPEGIDYPISVSALGFINLQTSIDVLSDTTKELTMEKATYDVTFVLSDQDGTVEGEVSFDGRTITSKDGKAEFLDVNYGLNKEFTVSSYGCDTIIDTLDVNSHIQKGVVLNANKFDILFAINDGADPIQDAKVEFYEKLYSTDINGHALFDQIKQDTALNYTIQKTGFDNISGSLDVFKDSTLTLSMNNGKALYEICFEVLRESNPIYNAQVIFNEDTLYTDTSGRAIFQNVEEADSLVYKIYKPHFNLEEGVVNLTADNITVVKNLTYKTYVILFNVVDEDGPVSDATVLFNAQEKITDNNGQCTFDLVYSLNRTYEINKSGYENLSGMINVTEDKVIEASVLLKKYTVTFIVKDPSENPLESVMVEFNGSTKNTDINGESVFSELLPKSDMSFTLSKDGFWNYDSVLNVVDEDIIFNARMSSTTGTVNLSVENFNIYPNPSNGIFTIEITDILNESCHVKIFNVIGSMVYNKKFSGNHLIKEQIDITTYAKGIYFVSVESGKGSVYSKRILVK